VEESQPRASSGARGRTSGEHPGSARVIEVVDELVLASVPAVETRLVAAIETGATSVVVDLSGCEFLDSSGLAMLVRAQRRLSEHQRLALVVPHRIVRRAFEAARLDATFAIHPTREAALEERRDDGPRTAARDGFGG
jgi:anti-sigma B factor antagonist